MIYPYGQLPDVGGERCPWCGAKRMEEGIPFHTTLRDLEQLTEDLREHGADETSTVLFHYSDLKHEEKKEVEEEENGDII